MRSDALNALFDAGRLWQGVSAPQFPVVSTGIEALDAALTGGGWPQHMLIEWLTDTPLSLPLRCLIKTWQQQTDQRRLVCVNPPYPPSAEGFLQQGIQPGQVDIIQAQDHHLAWCLEQLAKSAAVASIIAWDAQQFSQTIRRRFQLACQQGQTQLFLVCPLVMRGKPSPAPIRMTCTLSATGEHYNIFKQPGAAPRELVVPTHLPLWLKTTSPTARGLAIPIDTHRTH